MRKQILILVLLSFLLLAFTSATVAYLKKDVGRAAAFRPKTDTCEKTAETFWEVLTRQIIGAVTIGI